MRARVLLLALPVAWLACFSSNKDKNTSGPSFDASFESSFPESGVPEATTPRDASEAASPVDASVVEAEAGPQAIAVIVGGADGLESGINVVFSDANGAVVLATTTNGGTAATFDPTVTTATVILGTPSNPNLYTFAGLVPGNTVLVPDRSSLAPYENVVANVPSAPSPSVFDGGVAQYWVESGTCNGSGEAFPISYSLFPLSGQQQQPCVGLAAEGASFGAAFPVLVEARDVDGNLEGYAYAKDNPLSSALDAGDVANVPVGGSWSTQTTTQAIAVSNLPAVTAEYSVSYAEVADGILNPLPLQAPGADAGADVSYVVQTHAGFADAVLAQANFSGSEGQFGSQENILAWSGPPPSSDGTVTLDSTGLATAPTFTSANFVTPDGGEGISQQPVVAWTLASGDLSAATGIIVHFTWYGTGEDGGSQSGTWTLVSPGTSASSLATPALPAQLSAYFPSDGTEDASVTDIVAVYGQASLPTYSSLLPSTTLFVPQVCGFHQPLVPPLPGVGAALFVVYETESEC